MLKTLTNTIPGSHPKRHVRGGVYVVFVLIREAFRVKLQGVGEVLRVAVEGPHRDGDVFAFADLEIKRTFGCQLLTSITNCRYYFYTILISRQILSQPIACNGGIITKLPSPSKALYHCLGLQVIISNTIKYHTIQVKIQ